MNKYYIHTLSGRLAQYVENEQISYCGNRIVLEDILVKDLKTIRKNEERSRQWRKKKGFSVDYGLRDYIIVYL